ncbi:hypothetical protein MITS9509_01068 [Synechococcus sp. MIT S9509]|nr:hypothetical protein MITS9504_00632 [Synechococcus sp. MIT S9504]KZR92619.1 hypothetical protein MITS9509_01068 [Synechococcus sp. MIT S9509]
MIKVSKVEIGTNVIVVVSCNSCLLLKDLTFSSHLKAVNKYIFNKEGLYRIIFA